MVEINPAVRETVVSEVGRTLRAIQEGQGFWGDVVAVLNNAGAVAARDAVQDVARRAAILAELNQGYQATLMMGGINTSAVLNAFGLA